MAAQPLHVRPRAGRTPDGGPARAARRPGRGDRPPRTSRLPAIRDALARLHGELEGEQPDGTRLRELLERLLAEVEALHAGALTFMRSLGDLMRTVERVGEEEFERGKGALLEHLQGFRRSRRTHSAEILNLIEKIDRAGVDGLVHRIVAAEPFVSLPGGATIAQQQRRPARRAERALGRPPGVVRRRRRRGSPWRTLNDQVLDAVRAVLAIAERLIERRSVRVDRAGVLLRLAGLVASAPPGEPTAWLRAAFGLRTPRHVGVPRPRGRSDRRSRAGVLARSSPGRGGRPPPYARRPHAGNRAGSEGRRSERGPTPVA